MKPLIVLLTTFVVTIIGTRIFSSAFDYSFAGKLAMAVMLVFTAIGHFAFKKGMAMMLPKAIPLKTEIIFLTGILEIVLAIGLLIPIYSNATGWALIAMFIVFLPANIYAAIHKIDYQKGTNNGSGLSYLWFRVPLQIFFIAWVCIFVLNFSSKFSILPNSALQ